MHMHKITTRRAWSESETRAVIRLYLQFWDAENSGEAYSKAKPVRELAATLGRSKGSIEAKLMNVSAVFVQLGRPFVTGYKPASNFAKDMPELVAAELTRRAGQL